MVRGESTYGEKNDFLKTGKKKMPGSAWKVTTKKEDRGNLPGRGPSSGPNPFIGGLFLDLFST